MQKPSAKTMLQVAGSVLLVVLLVSLIDLNELVALFAEVRFGWFLLGVLVVLLDQVVMGAKWHVLLRAMNIKVALMVPVIAYLRARAFKYLVPSTLGVDAYKAYYVRRYHPNASQVVASIFVERLLGALSSLLLVVLLWYFLADSLRLSSNEWLGWISVSAIIFSLAALYLLIRYLSHLSELSVWQRLPDRVYTSIRPALDSLRLLKDQSRRLYIYIGCSLIEKLFFGLTLFICAVSLGIDQLSLLYVMAATPVLALLERIPISISSIGLREGLMVALLTPVGIAPAQTIAIALMLRAVEITQIVLLIFIWYVDHTPPPSDEELQRVS